MCADMVINASTKGNHNEDVSISHSQSPKKRLRQEQVSNTDAPASRHEELAICEGHVLLSNNRLRNESCRTKTKLSVSLSSKRHKLLKVLRRKMQEGKFEQVYQLLRSHQYPANQGDLIRVWDQAHYREKEITMGRQLSPVLRFRIRQRYPPPATICPGGSRPTMALPVDARQALKDWLDTHTDHPYPTVEERHYLAMVSGLSVQQVRTWFANARRRLRNICSAPKNDSQSGPTEDADMHNNPIMGSSRQEFSRKRKQQMNEILPDYMLEQRPAAELMSLAEDVGTKRIKSENIDGTHKKCSPKCTSTTSSKLTTKTDAKVQNFTQETQSATTTCMGTGLHPVVLRKTLCSPWGSVTDGTTGTESKIRDAKDVPGISRLITAWPNSAGSAVNSMSGLVPRAPILWAPRNPLFASPQQGKTCCFQYGVPTPLPNKTNQVERNEKRTGLVGNIPLIPHPPKIVDTCSTNRCSKLPKSLPKSYIPILPAVPVLGVNSVASMTRCCLDPDGVQCDSAGSKLSSCSHSSSTLVNGPCSLGTPQIASHSSTTLVNGPCSLGTPQITTASLSNHVQTTSMTSSTEGNNVKPQGSNMFLQRPTRQASAKSDPVPLMSVMSHGITTIFAPAQNNPLPPVSKVSAPTAAGTPKTDSNLLHFIPVASGSVERSAFPLGSLGKAASPNVEGKVSQPSACKQTMQLMTPAAKAKTKSPSPQNTITVAQALALRSRPTAETIQVANTKAMSSLELAKATQVMRSITGMSDVKPPVPPLPSYGQRETVASLLKKKASDGRLCSGDAAVPDKKSFCTEKNSPMPQHIIPLAAAIANIDPESHKYHITHSTSCIDENNHQHGINLPAISRGNVGAGDSSFGEGSSIYGAEASVAKSTKEISQGSVQLISPFIMENKDEKHISAISGVIPGVKSATAMPDTSTWKRETASNNCEVPQDTRVTSSATEYETKVPLLVVNPTVSTSIASTAQNTETFSGARASDRLMIISGCRPSVNSGSSSQVAPVLSSILQTPALESRPKNLCHQWSQSQYKETSAAVSENETDLPTQHLPEGKIPVFGNKSCETGVSPPTLSQGDTVLVPSKTESDSPICPHVVSNVGLVCEATKPVSGIPICSISMVSKHPKSEIRNLLMSVPQSVMANPSSVFPNNIQIKTSQDAPTKNAIVQATPPRSKDMVSFYAKYLSKSLLCPDAGDKSVPRACPISQRKTAPWFGGQSVPRKEKLPSVTKLLDVHAVPQCSTKDFTEGYTRSKTEQIGAGDADHSSSDSKTFQGHDATVGGYKGEILTPTTNESQFMRSNYPRVLLQGKKSTAASDMSAKDYPGTKSESSGGYCGYGTSSESPPAPRKDFCPEFSSADTKRTKGNVSSGYIPITTVAQSQQGVQTTQTAEYGGTAQLQQMQGMTSPCTTTMCNTTMDCVNMKTLVSALSGETEKMPPSSLDCMDKKPPPFYVPFIQTDPSELVGLPRISVTPCPNLHLIAQDRGKKAAYGAKKAGKHCHGQGPERQVKSPLNSASENRCDSSVTCIGVHAEQMKTEAGLVRSMGQMPYRMIPMSTAKPLMGRCTTVLTQAIQCPVAVSHLQGEMKTPAVAAYRKATHPSFKSVASPEAVGGAYVSRTLDGYCPVAKPESTSKGLHGDSGDNIKGIDSSSVYIGEKRDSIGSFFSSHDPGLHKDVPFVPFHTESSWKALRDRERAHPYACNMPNQYMGNSFYKAGPVHWRSPTDNMQLSVANKHLQLGHHRAANIPMVRPLMAPQYLSHDTYQRARKSHMYQAKQSNSDSHYQSSGEPHVHVAKVSPITVSTTVHSSPRVWYGPSNNQLDVLSQHDHMALGSGPEENGSLDDPATCRHDNDEDKMDAYKEEANPGMSRDDLHKDGDVYGPGSFSEEYVAARALLALAANARKAIQMPTCIAP